MTNSTDQELLPCPFCGDPNPNLTHDDYVHEGGSPMAVVECTKCHTWVQAEAWNKRANQPAGLAVPEGWKLVPVEPTTNMVNAIFEGVAVTSRGGLLNVDHALAAAINAAPHPVRGEQP